jgi:hypothetical protein
VFKGERGGERERERERDRQRERETTAIKNQNWSCQKQLFLSIRNPRKDRSLVLKKVIKSTKKLLLHFK